MGIENGFNTLPTKETATERPAEVFDSKFGNSEAMLAYIEQAPASVLGSAQELLETNPYTNRVDVVALSETELHGTANAASLVSFKSDLESTVYGIFKPVGGENQERKMEMGYGTDKALYPHEKAAYLVSRHFGLDLVPPTTIREIDGQPGSVQLLLSPDQYLTLPQFLRDRTTGDPVEAWLDYIGVNMDTDAMALLDYIIAGPDRHMRNLMIQGGTDIPDDDLHENLNLAAIDNGLSFNTRAFNSAEILNGPLVMRTTNDDPESRHQRNNFGSVMRIKRVKQRIQKFHRFSRGAHNKYP